jgi:predicted Fe-S protein YdhL (DUF1289 family)
MPSAADPSIDSPIDSPCTRVCVLDPASQLCAGCGRSLDEIASWIGLGEQARGRIMAQLPARLAAMSGRTTASAIG